MAFENIIGNTQIITAIKKSIENNRLSHAYIIEGEIGSGKKTIALEFTKAILCGKENCHCSICTRINNGNHSDVIRIQKLKDKKNLSVDQIRDDINATVDTKPFESKYKIYIIENAETMNQQSQNALLKTIESPPEYCVFIMLTSNINSFLPTILSRCITYKTKAINDLDMKNYLKNKYDIPDMIMDIYINFSNGNIQKATNIIENDNFNNMRRDVTSCLSKINTLDLVGTLNLFSVIEKYKDNINEVFELAILWYRDILVYKETKKENLIIQKDKKDDIIGKVDNFTIKNLLNKINIIEKTAKDLEYNGNFQMTIETMLLKLKEK